MVNKFPDFASILEPENISEKRSYSKGEVLFTEGDPADALFIVRSGSVILSKISPDGKEQVIRTVTKGESFAEAAVFSGVQYPATAIAREKSSLLLIKKARFIEYIRQRPEIALKMMGAMSELLRHLNNLVAELKLEPVINRLAKYLVNESKKQHSSTVKLPISKQELARELGTIGETLSRNFKKLESKKMIKVKKDSIIIKDLKLLTSLYI